MLKKNHFSSYILGIINLVGALALSIGLFFVLKPEIVTGWPPLAAILVVALIFAVLLFFFSRSPLVMGLNESEGFGLRGLLRWLALGMISGFLVYVFYENLLPIVPMVGFFSNLFELVVTCMVLLISYWIVFGHRIFKHGEAVATADLVKEWKIYRWYYLIAGPIFLAVFWNGAIQGLAGNAALFWLSAGGVCMGLCALLIGVQYWPKRSDGLDTRLTWGAFAMAGLAFVLFTVGLLA